MDSIKSFSGKYAWLSNFYPSTIVYEGIVYPTVEHAFQAAKTLDINERIRISQVITPGIAKKEGRKVTLRANWDNIKASIMDEMLNLKFAQIEFKTLLIATGDARLKEGNRWHDNFFGSCTCSSPKCGDTGSNRLGWMIMAIRTKLLQNP